MHTDAGPAPWSHNQQRLIETTHLAFDYPTHRAPPSTDDVMDAAVAAPVVERAHGPLGESARTPGSAARVERAEATSLGQDIPRDTEPGE